MSTEHLFFCTIPLPKWNSQIAFFQRCLSCPSQIGNAIISIIREFPDGLYIVVDGKIVLPQRIYWSLLHFYSAIRHKILCLFVFHTLFFLFARYLSLYYLFDILPRDVHKSHWKWRFSKADGSDKLARHIYPVRFYSHYFHPRPDSIFPGKFLDNSDTVKQYLVFYLSYFEVVQYRRRTLNTLLLH